MEKDMLVLVGFSLVFLEIIEKRILQDLYKRYTRVLGLSLGYLEKYVPYI